MDGNRSVFKNIIYSLSVIRARLLVEVRKHAVNAMKLHCATLFIVFLLWRVSCSTKMRVSD